VCGSMGVVGLVKGVYIEYRSDATRRVERKGSRQDLALSGKVRAPGLFDGPDWTATMMNERAA